MTQVLFLHQLRFDLLTMRRNRRSQFFILLLPLLLLAAFAGLYGTATVEVAGHHVAANRASVPGVMSLAVLTGSFMALVMTVVTSARTASSSAAARRRSPRRCSCCRVRSPRRCRASPRAG